VRKRTTLIGIVFIVMGIISLFLSLAGLYSPCFGWIDFLALFVIGLILIVKSQGYYD
jgi:hypothetical protein